MSIANTGSVDLEAVLNVGRRTLVSIGETSAAPFQQPCHADTVYLKREDNSNSIFSVDSKIFIFGELQLLCNIFERYTSHMTFFEKVSHETNSSSPSSSNKPIYLATLEKNEPNTHEEPPIISTLRHTSISSSKGSASPTCSPGVPRRRQTFNSTGRKLTVSSTASEYSAQNLDGKRYGCIELPHMTTIEIMEILLRSGLELVNVSSDYDKNTLHQSFVFSKTRKASQKHGQNPSK
ncbi:unnamed protein product [Rotaria socialis]|uniref:Uncharacterized protein n=1 Tax=Rotaria socialis TaxID=392032 RepID=A0A820I4H6_9BILA|nr:unnamed protein product [Rotaria socialis]CAF3478721.1 unnamed protein product [Rotaria socialis]CAF4306465.1 unnamed protein product [Rotaria socialis]CAF4638739.1 unnamed protein product [Rotaria socialis]